MMKSRTAVAAAMILCGTGAADAASVIELRGTDLDQPIRNDIEINGQRARVTIHEGGETTDIQFNADSGVAYVIDHREKTYLELTEEGIVQMGAQMQNMMAQIQAQMEQAAAGMSEEQRAQLDGLLGQLGSPAPVDGAPPQSATFTRSGKSGEVAGMPCDRGTLSAGGENVDLCVARRADIDLPAADYETLRAMIDFAGRIAGRVSTLFPGAAATVPSFDLDALDGLPVEVRDAQMHVAVTSVSQQPRPPISLPDGYAKRTNPFTGL